jgi:Holliday junction DNA helicase RuvA
MISSLKGKVGWVRGKQMEIEVSGIGYLVWAGKGNFVEGQEIKVYTHMAVSENDVSLYGFETIADLDLFKMLITVSGVGPKTAAQILGSTGSLEIIKAIGEADVDFFKKIKGIGLKTAQRIIVDLKSRIGGLGELNLKDNLPLLEDDLVLSLRQLGFERREIETVVRKTPPELTELEKRLDWCLQNIK